MSAAWESGERGKVAVIGSGRVGTAVAYVLASRGYRVVGVYSLKRADAERAADLLGSVTVDDPVEAARAAEIILITTPDDSIEDACRALASSIADLSGKKFIHMSGALSLSALEPASERGADVLCVHPLQTFADLEGALESLPGSAFGVTCDPALEGWVKSFVEDLDGRPVMITDSDRPLYHAAAVLASNLPVMIEGGVLTLCRELGVADEAALGAFMPLAGAAIENVGRLGPARALTGPLARGDVGTLKANLDALRGSEPELAEVYRVVSRWGLRLVEERGEVEKSTIDEMRRALGGATPEAGDQCV